MRRWFVVLCKGRQEERAAQGMTAQGIVAFVPMRTEWERDGRQLKPIAVPMFERYVFVVVDPQHASQTNAWGRIKNSRGVTRLLCDASGKPQPMRPRIMRDIHRRHRNREKRPKRIALRFNPGDHVQLLPEVWRGRVGIVAGYERSKVRVFVGALAPLVKEEDLERFDLGAEFRRHNISKK